MVHDVVCANQHATHHLKRHSTLQTAFQGECAWCRVSEMLEVVQKADRLHVEENLQRSMSASPSSDNQSVIQFKEVRTFLCQPHKILQLHNLRPPEKKSSDCHCSLHCSWLGCGWV